MTKNTSVVELLSTSHLGASASYYLEDLYELHQKSPNMVAQVWRDYFASIKSNNMESKHRQIRENLIKEVKNKNYSSAAPQVLSPETRAEVIAVQVLNLIDAYRRCGHQEANIDPLQLTTKVDIDVLQLAYHDLTNTNIMVDAQGIHGLHQTAIITLHQALRDIYCRSVGVEYMYITKVPERHWLQTRLEQNSAVLNYSPETKKRLLLKLMQAEGLEHYLHTKYVGQKRFSLEGSDAFIPLVDELIQRAGSQGVKVISIGLAHRGRLNVLVNVLGKSAGQLFSEFDGEVVEQDNSSGDVKYHMGFSADIKTPGGAVHVALAFNPSHLEIVSPVVEGSVRARQQQRGDIEHNQILPILVHGDAAFSGQGVVMETLNMSQLKGYKTGGTVHVIINNQVGFTTSAINDSRSTTYCTDVAKMLEVPIFHVNGDDPEAVLNVTQIALDYRMTFHKDVVIDLISYRKHGHNEADEPAATQPMMYKKIRKHLTAKTLYAQALLQEQVITEQDIKQITDDYRLKLDNGEVVIDEVLEDVTHHHNANWQKYTQSKYSDAAVVTAVSQEKIISLAKIIYDVPESFILQKQVAKIIAQRQDMATGKRPVDWGFAETLAYATLLSQGYNIRLSGQDSERGTFAHRHSVLHEQNSGEIITNLSNINIKSRFEVINSFLSEAAVLAFEYGYTTTDPDTLTLWEAQFGDFANGAQVVIDQFISSGQAKWGRLSGLVMLLPHGFEGMGPEHSSARLERYMQLCAEHNIQVCVPTTSAQIFHLLRRQMLCTYRCPLIIMTPKSLLRHKLATSSLNDLSQGAFQQVIPEIEQILSSVRRVILCAGKVYYDLLQYRQEHKVDNVVLIRLEQLYPFPEQALQKIMSSYAKVADVLWCQEEPENQGAWYCILHHLNKALQPQQKISYCGRKAAASPAVGSSLVHKQQQQRLVEEAFTL